MMLPHPESAEVSENVPYVWKLGGSAWAQIISNHTSYEVVKSDVFSVETCSLTKTCRSIMSFLR